MRKRKPVLLNGEALMADGKPLEFDAVDQRELDGKIDAPQTAQVGEVLTVEEVDEDGKPIKWKTQTVDVDGVLKYTEQELTSDEQTQARENIGAQQTDFIINVEKNEDGVFAADKTLVEIKTAYESKVNMWAVFYGDRYVFQGYLGLTGSYLFAHVMDNVITKYGSISMIEFNSNGNISMHGMQFTALSKMEQIIVGNGGAISGVPLGQNPVSENATYVTVPKASGLKAGKVLTTTGKNGVLAMEWKDINFYVTITSTTTDGVTTYTADKTFAEIKAAYESGANVYALLNGIILSMSGVQNDLFMFCAIVAGTQLGVLFISQSEIILRVFDYSGAGDSNLTYLITGNNSNLKFYKNAKVFKKGQYNNGVLTTKSDFIKSIFATGVNAVIVYDDIKYYCQYMDHGFTKFCGSDSNNIKTITVSENGDEGEIIFDDMPTFLPSPATAQVGQIVRVKSVDADGMITETETVDMPSVSNDYELVFQETIAEDIASYTRDTDKDGNPFSLTDVMVIIFTKPFAESTNNAGRAIGFLPTTRWGHDTVGAISGLISSTENATGCYDMLYVSVINGKQVVTANYRSQNRTNVFGTMMLQTSAGTSGMQFHTNTEKLMEFSNPEGNITCVRIVGYTTPLVSKGTIIALFKKKGT
nr:MAG TPA: hypothetical protein [Caudoviricetes sp.]